MSLQPLGHKKPVPKPTPAEQAAIAARRQNGALASTFSTQNLTNVRGASPETYINPPADPRLNSALHRWGYPLKQGIVQQTEAAAGAVGVAAPKDESTSANNPSVVNPQKTPFACRFMFNPTTLVYQYGATEDALHPAQWTPNQGNAVDISASQNSLSFSLLFDRTYEVAYNINHGPYRLRDLGVLVDIHAMERVVGARWPFASNPEGLLQPMKLIPCYFIFGGGANSTGVTFVGHITGLTVELTSFSSSMVPIRARVDITAQQLFGQNPLQAHTRSLLNRESDQRRDQAAAGRGGGAAPRPRPRPAPNPLNPNRFRPDPPPRVGPQPFDPDQLRPKPFDPSQLRPQPFDPDQFR